MTGRVGIAIPPALFKFCLPTGAKVVPDGPDWLHEIKYDGLYEASRVKDVSGK